MHRGARGRRYHRVAVDAEERVLQELPRPRAIERRGRGVAVEPEAVVPGRGGSGGRGTQGTVVMLRRPLLSCRLLQRTDKDSSRVLLFPHRLEHPYLARSPDLVLLLLRRRRGRPLSRCRGRRVFRGEGGRLERRRSRR